MMMDDADSDLSGVAVVALIIIAAAVGVGAGAWALHRSARSPQRILDRRYATGELSRDEYLQRRSDLKPE